MYGPLVCYAGMTLIIIIPKSKARQQALMLNWYCIVVWLNPGLTIGTHKVLVLLTPRRVGRLCSHNLRFADCFMEIQCGPLNVEEKTHKRLLYSEK